MFDLDDLFESIDIGPKGGPRLQAFFRILFGLLGTGLAAAGCVVTLSYEAGLAFRLAGAALFFFMGCFCFFNVVLHRPWRWPGRGFVASFVGIFVVRIVFGA